MHLNEMIILIKKRRETLDINQENLADLAGIGLRTLKLLEGGKGNPTLETLEKISVVLGLEVKLEVKKTHIGNK